MTDHSLKAIRSKKISASAILLIATIFVFIVFVIYIAMVPKIVDFKKIDYGFYEAGLSWGMSMGEVKKATRLEIFNDKVVGYMIAFDRIWKTAFLFNDEGLIGINMGLVVDNRSIRFPGYLGYRDKFMTRGSGDRLMGLMSAVWSRMDIPHIGASNEEFQIFVKDDYTVLMKYATDDSANNPSAATLGICIRKNAPLLGTYENMAQNVSITVLPDGMFKISNNETSLNGHYTNEKDGKFYFTVGENDSSLQEADFNAIFEFNGYSTYMYVSGTNPFINTQFISNLMFVKIGDDDI